MSGTPPCRALILCRNDGGGELAAPVLLLFGDAAAGGVGLVASPAVAGVANIPTTETARKHKRESMTTPFWRPTPRSTSSAFEATPGTRPDGPIEPAT